jgi:hypothetical protein
MGPATRSACAGSASQAGPSRPVLAEEPGRGVRVMIAVIPGVWILQDPDGWKRGQVIGPG